MSIEIATYTDIGARDEQQDRVAVLANGNAHLLVVADGMGGHEQGALASQAVVDAASRIFTTHDGNDAVKLLTAIIEHAHRRINEWNDLVAGSPSSTCVLLHVGKGKAAWAHVGDSRLYRFKNGRMAERTLDHSIVELLRMEGRITEDEMGTHRDQGRLYEAVGGADHPNPDFGSKVVGSGDGFILVTDGIWGHTTEAKFEAVFTAVDLDAALSELAISAKAAAAEGCDNLSVVAYRHRKGDD